MCSKIKKYVLHYCGCRKIEAQSDLCANQYKGEDFETFKRMLWAVFYHHFNIHDTCGEWCSLLKNVGSPEELKKLHYWCKLKNAKLYERLLEIWEIYCSDKTLCTVDN
jgi:hypothetical protein